MTAETRPGVAVAGIGAWGQNLARVFHGLGALRWICDADDDRLAEVAARYPGVSTSRMLGKALAERSVRAVVIATPSVTHADITLEALRAGKDVLVEKPLALTYADGAAVVREAAARNAVLMVGHVLQYHPAVVHLRQLVSRGELGEVHYLWSTRMNLGRVRREENILWSFAPHDISVMLLLLDRMPSAVGVFGGAYLQPGIADVTVSSYMFPGGAQGHIFVSWLHPFKEQRLVVVGSEKMAVFEDTAPDKLRVYDKRITWVNGEPVPSERAEERIPLPGVEPLAAECAHFLDCVARRTIPRTDGREGLRVLRVLEAGQRSLEQCRVVHIHDEEIEGDV